MYGGLKKGILTSETKNKDIECEWSIGREDSLKC